MARIKNLNEKRHEGGIRVSGYCVERGQHGGIHTQPAAYRLAAQGNRHLATASTNRFPAGRVSSDIQTTECTEGLSGPRPVKADS